MSGRFGDIESVCADDVDYYSDPYFNCEYRRFTRYIATEDDFNSYARRNWRYTYTLGEPYDDPWCAIGIAYPFSYDFPEETTLVKLCDGEGQPDGCVQSCGACYAINEGNGWEIMEGDCTPRTPWGVRTYPSEDEIQ